MSSAGGGHGRVTRWYRGIVDSPTPLVKQLPTLIATAIAVVLTVSIPDLTFVSPVPAFTGVSVIVVASAAAWAMSRRTTADGWIVLLIPIADIVGLGLFRFGTGGASSLFTSIVLLPIVWIAAMPGFRYVLLVTGLTSFILLMPYAVEPPMRGVDWLRGVVAPVVFGAVAAVVNELSRQARSRVQEAERLMAERTSALEANERIVEQLREGEQRYRTLVDLYQSLWESITMQAVIATDSTGVVTAWNPGAHRLLGLSEEEALAGIRVDRFLPAHVRSEIVDGSRVRDAGDAVAALFARADSEAGMDGDFHLITAGGSMFPARMTVTPFKDGIGGTRGYLFVVSDESRAAEVARMKDEFVGMISHELRTPLSSIVGFVDLLQNDPENPLTDEQLGFVAVIDRNAQRLLTLVGDLLFTAQVESGRFPIDPVDTDIVAVVRAAATSAGPQAAKEGIDVVIDVPAHAVRMPADAGRIGQAVDNLLSNALKFTPRGGTVAFGVESTGGDVVVTVRDTGMGIPADEQKQLFTRFFRASTATRNAVPGVGLGLAITRAIVIAHGGEMQVHSEEGVGTEFRMVFPLAARADTAGGAAATGG